MFYSEEATTEKPVLTEVESLDRELDAGREAALLETKLSSLVWICTSTRAASIVTVIDANNPADILNSFGVCANHLMCIASVPGASLSDYEDDEVDVKATAAEEVKKEETDIKTEENQGTGVVNESKEANGEETEVDPDSLVSEN